MVRAAVDDTTRRALLSAVATGELVLPGAPGRVSGPARAGRWRRAPWVALVALVLITALASYGATALQRSLHSDLPAAPAAGTRAVLFDVTPLAVPTTAGTFHPTWYTTADA